MQRLKKLSERKTADVPIHFGRFLHETIDWSQRLIVVLGHRGAGKTTFLLQRMSRQDGKNLYLSLDDIYFEANRLITLIDTLYEEGYRGLYLDEVHRYEHWSRDLKNAYDNYPDIQIVATGSSILEVSQGQEDLSRRAMIYHLPGLSYREFLHLNLQIQIDRLSLEEIIHSHHEITAEFQDSIEIAGSFQNYLRFGYYPFFLEGITAYPVKLEEVTHLALDVDIASFEEVQYATIRNMKRLLYVISQSVPFKPNVARLAKKLDISRNLLLKMLDLLDRAQILSLLRSDTKGISHLQKPDKIYLQNPNLIYMLSDGKPNIGSLRETFFFNQLQVQHQVTSSKWGDFMIDDTYTFEVGGPAKTQQQIQGVPNAFIAADGIEGGSGNRIPLWLFGFLY